MSSISIIINTKNSAETLKRALESVKWANECIVVDMKSSDNTVEIAEKFGAKVFAHPDVGYVEPARNFAVSKATSDWVLVLDADEEVPETLHTYIQQKILDQQPEFVAVALPRKNMIFSRWMQHTGWWPDYQIRLFKKGAVTWSEKIHKQPEVQGDVTELPAKEELAILHHHYTSVEQFIGRLNNYTAFQANSEAESTVTAESLINRFSSQLFSRLFVQDGLKDGLHGLSTSFLQAMYELTVEMKKWEKQGFKDEYASPKKTLAALSTMKNGMEYWIADWHVHHTQGLEQLYWRFQRKRHTLQ